MNIDRAELLEKLYEYAVEDSGLIVGKPGIGKSFMIRQLKNKLVNDKILAFVIRIDNLIASDDNAINAELGLSGNWIEVFKKVKIDGKKAVLIFDAFDAARDEKLRRSLLTQIRNAKRNLADKWHILVSVRTYDASKSPDLIELFSVGTGDNKYPRRIDIPELSEEEVGQVVDQSAKFKALYDHAGAELRQILHNPFFLEIMDRLILQASSEEIDTFKLFKSESQLLNVFWLKKINSGPDGVARELFLSTLGNHLVADRSLSSNKLEILKQVNPNDRHIYDYFRSENILEEVSINQSRVAFAHNILFDYAVSRLCIEDAYDRFIAFLEADLTRPFFLRPSFVYFFTDLWYQERNVFWDFYFKLQIASQKEIKLFIRLVLNGIIASDFRQTSELSQIISSEGGTLPDATIIRNLLQSIRFIRTKSTPADVALLRDLVDHLALDFVFDFAFLLDRTISESQLSPGDYAIAAQTARLFLAYILKQREDDPTKFIDRIGAQRGIELVSKTYNENVNESRELLQKVFQIIEEPGFEINYFVNLANDVQYILPFDPEMVGQIYRVIFGYEEKSTETTDMSASVVLRLSSNRKQDFEMCYYRLQKFFPEFLAAAPELAIVTGLDVVNKFISEDRNEGRNEQIKTFEANGQTYQYQPDYSAIWGDNTWGKPSEMAQAIINYFKQLATDGNDDELTHLISLYQQYAVSAFAWKILFQFFLTYSKIPPKMVFDYVSNQLLLNHTDVSFEIRAMIEKFSPQFNDDQILAIENLTFETYDETKGSMVSRVLSMLPKGRLQSAQAKKYMSEHEVVPNQPAFSSTGFTSSPYTTDDWLRDQGVDLAASENKDIPTLSNELERFSHQNLNDIPTVEDYQDEIIIARKLSEQLFTENSEIHEDLFRSALGELAKFGAIVSRDFANLSQENYHFIQPIIAKAFNFRTPSDAPVSDSDKTHFTFSPTPRNSAAEALVNLYIFDQSNENKDRLYEGIRDENHIIRFNTVRNLQQLFTPDYQLYKEIITERLNEEKNAFIYSVLLGNIIFKKDLVATEAPGVLETISTKAKGFDDYESFVNNYVELLLYFMHDFGLEIAFNLLYNSYDQDHITNTVIFRLFEKMHPAMPENDFVHNAKGFEREIEIIRHYVVQAKTVISKVAPGKLNAENGEGKAAIFILDKIIQRIYFVLQPKTYGRNPSFDVAIPNENKIAFYFTIKPILNDIIDVSAGVTENGLIMGHTAHYFMQLLNQVLPIDPKDILEMVTKINYYSIQGGYTFDSFAIQEVVSLTEKLLADHRNLLLETSSFNNLLSLLDTYINSGWVNALELLWRLDEIFR